MSKLRKADAIFGTALLFVLLLAIQMPAETKARRVTLIDDGWRFKLDDVPGAETNSFPDQKWQRVNLPHSFSMPYFKSSAFYVGYGWYRRHFNMTSKPGNRRYSIEFDGVFQKAELFVNGQSVGRHSGGYTGFSIDVTKALHVGDNVIAVRVNNLWNARLNPRAGEHVFSGGIYRKVRLVETNSVHVSWYGTFVTTPDLDATGGPIKLEVEVANDSGDDRQLALITEIRDPLGKLVTTVRSAGKVNSQSSQTLTQISQKVQNPFLWSPQAPSLYRAVTRIEERGKVIDTYETIFGFRFIRWTAHEGFFLNGKRYYFRGANVHQDHAGWGDAVSDDAIARDIRLVKEAGFDFIRGSHYPHSPVFADECDRQGVLFWSENSFWGIGGHHIEGSWTASAYPPNELDQKPFEESVEQSLTEMIRINRNHPSIIAWSMTNEVFFSDAEVLPKIQVFLPRLVSLSHELDPTRPAGAGGVQRGGLDKLSEIAGYNGDGARLYIDPGFPSAVTEYGSTVSDRPGKYEPGFGDIDGQPEFPWRSGQAIWCAFDHGSLIPNLSRMGIIDYFRLPKRMWYWYRNAYRGVGPPEWPQRGSPEQLLLTSDKGSIEHADGRGDVQLIVSILDAQGKAISNDVPVTLEIVSGPGEFPTGRHIRFTPDSDIPIRDGKAAIEMRAFQSGDIKVRATSPGLRSATLHIIAGGAQSFVPGVTPIVEDRPYHRFEGKDPSSSDRPTDLSLNHPTRASSELKGHEGRFANDESPSTFWEPQQEEDSWWQLDFENRVRIQTIAIDFGRSGKYQVVVDVDDNDTPWHTVATLGSGATETQEVSISMDSPVVATGLRIRFVGNRVPPRLANVAVNGRPVQ